MMNVGNISIFIRQFLILNVSFFQFWNTMESEIVIGKTIKKFIARFLD